MSMNSVFTNRSESMKVELNLSLNAHDTPQEFVNHKAWANLIMQLVISEPGTWPTNPLMGVGLGTYNFETIDTFEREITDKIKSQVSTYLPEIPLDDVAMTSKVMNNSTSRYVIFVFSFIENSGLSNIAVVTEKTNKIINFEVAM